MKDGGPAFPVHTLQGTYNDGFQYDMRTPQQGMTLRDWFAGQVVTMPTMRLDETVGGWRGMCQSAAQHAYDLADAMLAERERER